jgi:hypothetical protein
MAIGICNMQESASANTAATVDADASADASADATTGLQMRLKQYSYSGS